MREKFAHYIRENELIDNELMEFRVIVHEQVIDVFTSAPSVNICGTKGFAVTEIFSNSFDAEPFVL